MKFLGYGRQSIDEKDIEAVVATLRGDFLTQGPAVNAFEEALARYVGARYAVAVSNGTAALHLACLAAGLKAGDCGVTQAITFVASANCMAYCGARPDLVDIESLSLNMSPDALRSYLRRNPECKVVIPVAMGGLSEGARIREVAGDRILIEDACHAFGAMGPDGVRVGGGRYADMTAFSFHPVKPITTGEGGAVVTNREDLYHRLLRLRSHGIARAPEALVDEAEKGSPWYYEQQELGFNYRLCDIQAALGLSQLRKIENLVARRRAIAEFYDHELGGIDGASLVQNDRRFRERSGHHIYVLRIDFDRLGTTRAAVMNALKERGIGTQVHYIPINHQPYYRERFKQKLEDFAESEAYYRQCLTLPCYPDLEDADLIRVVSAVKDVLRCSVRPENYIGADH